MAKEWFSFGRSRRRVTAGPQPSATLDDSTSARSVVTAARAEAQEVRAMRQDEGEPAAAAIVADGEPVTSAAAPAETPGLAHESAAGGDADVGITEPLTVEAVTPARGTPTRRLTGGPLPSYVDTQTATEWLAALADISAVTSYKALSYDLLDLQPEQTVTDIGCGIGDDARMLAGRVSPGGEVIGLDSSEAMIEKAIAAGTSPGLRFAVADAAALPLADGSCDAVRADRMLQHVEDPLRVLLEMRRVLKPGGRLVVIEPDWKTMALYPGSGAGGDDDRAARAIFEWHVAHTRHPLIGRQLRALLDEAGFGKIAVNPVAYSTTRFMEADLVLELTRAAESAARQWPDRLSADEARAWRTTARAADAASHFFASVPLYFGYALAE